MHDLKHLIQAERGLAARLARAAGISRPYVWQCANGERVLPERACPPIERETAGRLNVECMRADVRWIRVPDPDWPHPGGRPCIDVAPPVPQEARDAA